MVTDGAPKKKKKKKVSKKSTASGSAAASKSSTSTGSTSKTTTKKKKKKASSRAGAGSSPARSMRGDAQKPPEEGGSSTMLIGVVLAVAVVGGIVYMTSKKDETGVSPDASAAVSGSVAALPPKLGATGKPGAEQVPAPPDVAAPPKDAEKTASGLYSKVLKKGTGSEKPGPNDTVSVHYSGWTKDGKMFDSSIPRKRPQTFGVGGVIAGWTEGLQLMVVGEKRRLWIPGSLAYGDTAQRGRPSGQLTFDVELLEIKKAPETPEDLKEPPADAKKTASGLVYKVLEKGTGDTSPTDKDKVEVNYSGWTQDGKMFDSSITRGKPAKFGVTGVIKGWTEGLQLMKPGDKFRFWIPGDLAYGDTPKRPGGPSGTLVFDVELISIVGSPKPATSAAASAAASAPAPAAPAPAAPAPAAPKPAAPKPAAPKPAAPAPAAPKPAAPKPAAPAPTPYD